MSNARDESRHTSGSPAVSHGDPPSWFSRTFKPIGTVPTLGAGGTARSQPPALKVETKQTRSHHLAGSATGSDRKEV